MKTILILGAGLEQTIAIKEAKSLGLNVIACDQNEKAPGFKYADFSYTVDINDIDLIKDIAIKSKIDGIFTHAVEIPHVVAQIASNLGLPGLDPFVAYRATNKIERIKHLSENGIPCAKYQVINSYDELHEKAKLVGFPLIIKPIDNAGARGVQLVEKKVDLVFAYKEAVNFSKNGKVLIEEVLSGKEISTESVVFKGGITTFAFADRNYDQSDKFKPYFIEDGINYPTNLSNNLKNSVELLVEKTIRCLGIDFGAAKGDIIIDNGVPKIIEMAARTSGGWFGAGSIPAATGSNMLKPLIQMSIGEDPDLKSLEPSKNLGCAQRYIIPTQDGIVTEISGCQEALKSQGVVMSELFLPKIGDKIQKARSHADRYGQIICTAKTRESAIKKCESAISKIKIKLAPIKANEKN